MWCLDEMIGVYVCMRWLDFPRHSSIPYRFHSALAHVLLGQFKTAIIMILAAIIFGSKYSTVQLLGAAGAVLAILLYSQVTLKEKEVNKGNGSNDVESQILAVPLISSRSKDAR